MKFKPLILTMMREYLDGRKTQTRRLVRPPAPWVSTDEGLDIEIALGNIKSPIQPGELIWWKETLHRGDYSSICYSADLSLVYTAAEWPWKNKVLPARFMPKWACRAVAECLEVRVERVQEISEEDSLSEGFQFREHFIRTWDSLHGPGAWERNEYVWVYRFRPLKGDELKRALGVLNE